MGSGLLFLFSTIDLFTPEVLVSAGLGKRERMKKDSLVEIPWVAHMDFSDKKKKNTRFITVELQKAGWPGRGQWKASCPSVAISSSPGFTVHVYTHSPPKSIAWLLHSPAQCQAVLFWHRPNTT